MDDRVWKNLSIVLGIACAVLLGVAGALMVVHKGSPSAGSSPDASAISEGSQPPAGGSGNPAGQSPKVTQTPAGPTATPGKNAPATIAFTGLGLDADPKTNTLSTKRTFTFMSTGAGAVVIALTKISSGAAWMCADVDSSGVNCKNSKPGALQTFNFKSDPTPNQWTVTLYGYGTSAPTVDVSFTWTAASHKVAFAHGRMQGSSSPNVPEGLNGFTAQIKPAATGVLNLQASWTTITTDVEVSLSDVTTPPAVGVDNRQYSAVTFISPAYNFNVEPTKTYQLKLRDTAADSQRPDLTAQITFP